MATITKTAKPQRVILEGTASPHNSQPKTKKLMLRTAYGPVCRDVLCTPVRDARRDEIPIIDMSEIRGSLEARSSIAAKVKHACENTGFFYIKNHGIQEPTINRALDSSKSFFKQPEEIKQRISKSKGKFFNGYAAKGTGAASLTDGLDYRESIAWKYEPQYDPTVKDPENISAEIKSSIRGEDFVWQGTSHLPDFKEGCIAYWQECLNLARSLVKIFALALDLSDDHFDALSSYPGADGVFNYYPGMTSQTTNNEDVGLGSHTDPACFALLWQDMIGGLQVLTNEGQWIKASPVPGTIIVNIGDYLSRISNDRFKSTVHRVYNRSTVDRYSMPFFFGFNYNEKVAVLPTCVDEDHPPKYEPISYGDYQTLKFRQTFPGVANSTL